MRSYDDIHGLAGQLNPPNRSGHLNVEWLVPNLLAIGRDFEDRHLLVFGGPPVQARSEPVRRALMRGTWNNDSGESIEGTLLHLHQGEEFMVAATTIAAELFRRSVEDRPMADVFQEVEPFIELVIRRVLLPPESLLGLLGELVVFEELLSAIDVLPVAVRPDPLTVWQGHTRKSRDFRIHRLGLEVKTTSGPSSRHRIGGLDQVEPRMLDDEALEALFLVSIGLRPDDSGTSRLSVAKLSESILGKLTSEAAERFLDQLREYGPADCTGYDHATMATWEPYSRGFTTTFPPRVYDMSDENILVFRHASLQKHFPFVAPEGISFTLDLPDAIPGSHGANPRTDLRAELSRLVEFFV